MRKQVFLTVTAGKKLIGEALARRPDILETAENHTVVIIKGSTNAYFGEAICRNLHIDGFEPAGFYRGILKSAADKAKYPVQKNDLVIVNGKIRKDEDIYSIAPKLTRDDIIFKGANAYNPEENTCGVLIGNPSFGTTAPIMTAHIGRRTKLIHPVGLEKRVNISIQKAASEANDPETDGLRLALSDGQPYSEYNAFADLFDVHAELIAGGGIGSYEGGYLLLLEGEEDNLKKAETAVKEYNCIPAYQL